LSLRSARRFKPVVLQQQQKITVLFLVTVSSCLSSWMKVNLTWEYGFYTETYGEVKHDGLFSKYQILITCLVKWNKIKAIFQKTMCQAGQLIFFLISRRCIKTDKFGSFSVAFNYNRPSYIMKDKSQVAKESDILVYIAYKNTQFIEARRLRTNARRLTRKRDNFYRLWKQKSSRSVYQQPCFLMPSS